MRYLLTIADLPECFLLILSHRKLSLLNTVFEV